MPDKGQAYLVPEGGFAQPELGLLPLPWWERVGVRGTSPTSHILGKIVFVQLLHLVGRFGDHANPITNHQPSQFIAIHQTDQLVAGRDGFD